jgi:endonuclease/exonuclease/phosphatase family metal-dependent hydrolase
MLGGGLLTWPFRCAPAPNEFETPKNDVLVSAVGPLAHVYFGDQSLPLVDEDLEAIARDLTHQAHVPAVLRISGDTVVAWAGRDRLELPRDATRLFGESHPFLPDIADDLVDLCRHPDAGQLVLIGWRDGAQAISFPNERGSHGGPGPEETHAFALLPAENVSKLDAGFLRPFDLRQLAFDTLHPPRRHATGPTRITVKEQSSNGELGEIPSTLDLKEDETTTLRVTTYNVHSCIGMDGKLSPRRVARLVARCRPDVVALQELDEGRVHSEGADQAHAIAHELEMQHFFHPAWVVEEEKYGNAVLSRFPLELVQAESLPTSTRRYSEPRSAMWVRLDVAGEQVNLLNTHLGLSAAERMRHVDELLSENWIAGAVRNLPWIICGDFNMTPGSAAYRRLASYFRDAQTVAEWHQPRRTWMSSYPVSRIDHVFISDHFEVVAVEVHRSWLAMVASDHLPLTVEVRVRPLAHLLAYGADREEAT